MTKSHESPSSVRLPPEILGAIQVLEQQKNLAEQRQLEILGAYWVGIGAGRFDPSEWEIKDGVAYRREPPTAIGEEPSRDAVG